MKALKQVLPDYRINLVEASEIEHPELFHTSLQHVFTMLKYNSDKQKLYHYTRQHRKELQEMDDDSMLVLHPARNCTASTAYFAICRVVVSQRRNHSASFLRLAG